MNEQCLREVTNANGVTYYIFNEHSPLAECINIDIPKYIDTLEPGAFDGCNNTTFVTPQTVLKVMPDAFHGSAMME